MSDILTASTSAYYFHKGRDEHRIRKFFIELDKQIISTQKVRDSNEELAKKFFSK